MNPAQRQRNEQRKREARKPNPFTFPRSRRGSVGLVPAKYLDGDELTPEGYFLGYHRVGLRARDAQSAARFVAGEDLTAADLRFLERLGPATDVLGRMLGAAKKRGLAPEPVRFVRYRQPKGEPLLALAGWMRHWFPNAESRPSRARDFARRRS